MSITKDSVMALREKTGAGLIDCKRALGESNGDMEEAVSILRKKGVATAAKKSGRSASEGIIAQSISSDRSKGILVEVNCETDFVAKNEDFVAFSSEIAGVLLDNPSVDLEEKRTEQVAKIGENIQISRSETLAPNSTGIVESYVHTGAKVAVLLSVGSDSADVSANDRVFPWPKIFVCTLLPLHRYVYLETKYPQNWLRKKKKSLRLRQKGNHPKQWRKLFLEN